MVAKNGEYSGTFSLQISRFFSNSKNKTNLNTTNSIICILKRLPFAPVAKRFLTYARDTYVKL